MMNPLPLCPDRVQWTRGRIQNPCENWGLSPCVPVVKAGTRDRKHSPGRLYTQHAWERYMFLYIDPTPARLCDPIGTPVRDGLLCHEAGEESGASCQGPARTSGFRRGSRLVGILHHGVQDGEPRRVRFDDRHSAGLAVCRIRVATAAQSVSIR